MNAPLRQKPVAGRRKADALAFIERYLTERHISPTIDEVAGALGVSDTRAKQLVHQLAQDRAIERKPGSQRGISIPGLLPHLSAQGWVVNPGAETLDLPGFPKGQLPRLPDIVHIPDNFDAGIEDDHHQQ